MGNGKRSVHGTKFQVQIVFLVMGRKFFIPH